MVKRNYGAKRFGLCRAVLFALLALICCGTFRDTTWAEGTENEARAPYQVSGPVLLAQTQIKPQPTSKTVYEGADFQLDVYVYAGANEVSAADIHLSFDPTYLRLTRAPVPGSVLGQVGAVQHNNGAGTIDMGLYRTGSGATGTFRYCTLHFRAKATTGAGGTKLTSRSGPLVAAPGGVQLTSSWSDGTITIVTQPTPTQTLTPSITPTRGPTNTPTATATPVPGEVCVSAYLDVDEDGIADEGEPPLADASFTVSTVEGLILDTYVTDAESEPHCFSLPPNQVYVLSVMPPPVHEATGPIYAYIYPVEGCAYYLPFGFYVSGGVGPTPTPTVGATELYLPFAVREDDGVASALSSSKLGY